MIENLVRDQRVRSSIFVDHARFIADTRFYQATRRLLATGVYNLSMPFKNLTGNYIFFLILSSRYLVTNFFLKYSNNFNTISRYQLKSSVFFKRNKVVSWNILQALCLSPCHFYRMKVVVLHAASRDLDLTFAKLFATVLDEIRRGRPGKS